MRKQASHPALASIIRDRRVQVLPVQWRTLLQMDPEQSEEDHEHSMDNRFSMADITLNKSIPYVRELTNSVLLDIPLFMSHHRSKMIDSVCLQANKLYRLWIARHPDFEKYGRVHIIGHSVSLSYCKCLMYSSGQHLQLTFCPTSPQKCLHLRSFLDRSSRAHETGFSSIPAVFSSVAVLWEFFCTSSRLRSCRAKVVSAP